MTTEFSCMKWRGARLPSSPRRLPRRRNAPKYPATRKSHIVNRKLSGQAQIFQDLHGGGRLVERVKMQAGRAGAQQLLALARGVFDAEFHGRVVVRAESV